MLDGCTSTWIDTVHRVQIAVARRADAVGIGIRFLGQEGVRGGQLHRSMPVSQDWMPDRARITTASLRARTDFMSTPTGPPITTP